MKIPETVTYPSYRPPRFCLTFLSVLNLIFIRFSKMAPLTRRILLAGTSASAASALAGCMTSNPNPFVTAAVPPIGDPVSPVTSSPLAPPSGAVTPPFGEIYGEVKGEPHQVPAIRLGQINPAFVRTNVSYNTNESPGTIVIDPANHYLYHVEEGGRATRYGVGVGREGFVWAGEATIKSKQEWPDWYPPKEMVDRRPDLKRVMVELQSGQGMHGGTDNPLGARAMYLWQGNKDTYFRIHGTNEPESIGTSASSGCIRMINQDVIDLYAKTPVGTRVVVLGSPGAMKVSASG